MLRRLLRVRRDVLLSAAHSTMFYKGSHTSSAERDGCTNTDLCYIDNRMHTSELEEKEDKPRYPFHEDSCAGLTAVGLQESRPG